MSSVLGVMFAILVGLMALRPIVLYEQQGFQNSISAATAGEMQEITTAAQAYIQQNYAAVEANATATTPAVITIPMLQATGFLSSAIGSTNPFGQTWEVEVLQPTAGNLQGLVLSYGGNAIPQSLAPQIAAEAGQDGGFIPYQGEYGNLTSTMAEGAYNYWSVPLAGYTNVGAGDLASLVAFTNGNLQNDYLYRVAVPGQPQLNTMQTALNMGANSITNANNIVANGQVSAAGAKSTDFPAGFTGGVATVDIHANGTIAAGGPGSYQANISSYANGAQASGGRGFFSSPDQSQGVTIQSFGNSNTGDADVIAGPVNGGCTTDSKGHCSGQFVAAGQSETDLPAGWGGGVVTDDVYAQYTIADGPNGGPWQVGINNAAGGTWGSGGWVAVQNPNGQNVVISANPTTAYISTTGYYSPGYIANPGGSCSPNGAIAGQNNGSGNTFACVNAVWTKLTGFTQTYETTLTSGQSQWNASNNCCFTGGPMFVATDCPYQYPQGGATYQIYLYVLDQKGNVLSYSGGLTGQGGGDGTLYAAPSASAIVPVGDQFQVDITGAGQTPTQCIAMITN